MSAKKLPKLNLPKLRLVATVGNYYRVEIHGEDDLRDGPRNYALMNIAAAWTREEALQQARAWFSGLIDDAPPGAPVPASGLTPREGSATVLHRLETWFRDPERSLSLDASVLIEDVLKELRAAVAPALSLTGLRELTALRIKVQELRDGTQVRNYGPFNRSELAVAERQEVETIHKTLNVVLSEIDTLLSAAELDAALRAATDAGDK